MRLRLSHLMVMVVTAVAAASSAACSQADPQAAHQGHGGPACVTCHLPEYQSAAHHAGEKPTTCQICHGSDAWHPTGTHHPWPLEGAHAKAKCFDCHKGTPPVFKGTPKACAGCHQADYDKAPDHAGHFPVTCEDCHTTTAWKPLVPSPKWPAGQDPTPSASGKPTVAPTASTSPKPTPNKPTPNPRPQPTPKPQPPPDTTSTASKRY